MRWAAAPTPAADVRVVVADIAEDGRVAVGKVRQTACDLVLMDMDMQMPASVSPQRQRVCAHAGCCSMRLLWNNTTCLDGPPPACPVSTMCCMAG